MPEILTRPGFDTGEILGPLVDVPPEMEADGDETDYQAGDWFCLNTLPFSCPRDGCDYVAEFVTAGHLIVVWPQQDDPSLLRTARLAHDNGRSPRVREYDPDFGPCISYDRWVQKGRPVHGFRPSPRPDWWR